MLRFRAGLRRRRGCEADLGDSVFEAVVFCGAGVVDVGGKVPGGFLGTLEITRPPETLGTQ
jgi:hypothetical protein